LKNLELDDELAAMVYDERLQKNRVTRSQIVAWGRELSAELNLELNCSNGWLESFLERHHFVLCQVTNKPVHSDTEIISRATGFVVHIKSLIKTYNISPNNIYSLDETAMFFDHCRNKTIDMKGAKFIQVSFILISDSVVSRGKAAHHWSYGCYCFWT
jgi:hypothetical protein